MQPHAQFDYLVALKDSDDRAKAIISAMESIEDDYESLHGTLPKKEYRELDNEILGQLLRALNPEELKKVDGDVFGRIYEYFLTQFADQKAHDGGEFFTPISLVSLIANVLEPRLGTLLDPACGSGGMFVQSARFIEKLYENPNEKLSFYGLEKNATTINLAKMNLAVHGLVGDIKKAITYYEDPHNLCKKADFVMANPPFNVDEIDADKIKNDPRLPFGLPGVNKKGKVSNGNYIWISYFYSYLSEQGRSGFVMSSQASSAGRGEAKVRQKIIESGHVDIMIAIRSNFFYTRTVPCELWFFNKVKPAELKNEVLMIDARNIYRKVTRKIYDFSPEQLQNILSIVWLYRGETKRFHDLVVNYIQTSIDKAIESIPIIINYEKEFERLNKEMRTFFITVPKDEKQKEILKELSECTQSYKANSKVFAKLTEEKSRWLKQQEKDSIKLTETLLELEPLGDLSSEIIKEADLIYRLINRLIDIYLNYQNLKENNKLNAREITNLKKQTEEARDIAINQLKKFRYFYHQAEWLVTRFPGEKLCDVEGLVKLADKEEIKENDWSLAPGRYVGVAPEEEDPDFDFSETMHTIHNELESLNDQANELVKNIIDNFHKLEI